MKKSETLGKNKLVVYKQDNSVNRLLYPEYTPSKVFPSMMYATNDSPEKHDYIELNKDNLKLFYSKSKKLGTLENTFCGIPFKKITSKQPERLYFSGISGKFLGTGIDFIPNHVRVYLFSVGQVLDSTVDEMINFFINE